VNKTTRRETNIGISISATRYSCYSHVFSSRPRECRMEAIVGSETDGQEEPVKLAHLLGKDSYNLLEYLLENTISLNL
jgi:hypothetical protein